MYGCIGLFLEKLCLWEIHLPGDNLADFPLLKLVSKKWKWSLNYIPQIVELSIQFQKRLSDIVLRKLTKIVQLGFLNVHGVKGKLQWRYWMTVLWHWRWSMMLFKYQNSTNILEVLTLNMKNNVECVPVFGNATFVSSCFPLWNRIKLIIPCKKVQG